MKKINGIALLSFVFLVSLSSETSEAGWRESFDRAFASTVGSSSERVSPAVESRYLRLVRNRVDPIGDPVKAGESAALLMFRYEKDIRSGYDLQEAGARLVQAANMMNRDGNPEEVLHKLEMVRNGAKAGNGGRSGAAGNSASGAGRDMRGRDKGN